MATGNKRLQVLGSRSCEFATGLVGRDGLPGVHIYGTGPRECRVKVGWQCGAAGSTHEGVDKSPKRAMRASQRRFYNARNDVLLSAAVGTWPAHPRDFGLLA